MMLKPSIDSLLNQINSKYSLVILASKRAHELDAGAKATIDEFESVKSVGQALEEIEAATIVNHLNPDLKREQVRLAVEAKKAKAEQEKRELEDKMRQEQERQAKQARLNREAREAKAQLEAETKALTEAEEVVAEAVEVLEEIVEDTLES
ncbi:DNA-directed RNA polymerase omega subunit [Enterococcus sp. PF1-24]|nr:DNA-directed RNA polymerase omega subunit [Enterococcus sp. PFB1-1]MDH6401349.1 DNA-directed RNA polymerase omega subunit [Enterococcus sp. PF1-24]